MAQQNKPILVGIIVGVHGIKGLVKIRSFLNNPQDLSSFKTLHQKDGSPFPALKVIHVKGEVAITQIKGLTDRTEAEHLRNTELFIDQVELPPLEEDTFYQANLIGLEVCSLKGKPLGSVISIQDFGAGTLLEIQLTSQKDTVFVPFTDKYVPLVDIKKGFVQIDDSFIDEFKSPS